MFSQIFPFLYILLNNKSEKTYKHLFQFIDSNLFKFHAFSFRSDFEKGLRNALKTVFPTAKIWGCWFHYIRAIKRRAAKIPNFTANLNKTKTLYQIFTKFFVLPLLKPDDIVLAFENLKNQAKQHPIFSPFIKYFEKQWIKMVKTITFIAYW